MTIKAWLDIRTGTGEVVKKIDSCCLTENCTETITSSVFTEAVENINMTENKQNFCCIFHFNPSFSCFLSQGVVL